MRYIVIRDRIGRYVFIPVITGPMDCSGLVRRAVKNEITFQTA